jgi:hypothetical protein
LATFRELLITTESQLEAADLHFGHGYFDAHDEAVALVLAAEGLDPLTGSEILDCEMSDIPLLISLVMQRWAHSPSRAINVR